MKNDLASDEAEKLRLEKERDTLTLRLAEMVARVSRKRRVLEQTQQRAKEKMNCLVREMEEDGEDMTQTVIDASNLESDLFGFFPDPSSAPETSSSSQLEAGRN